jgi:hypothetical protein
MNAYVEECRREWRRLGVPDLLAEEMATELESDLAEAEADGVSAAEMLGESDPRRFAATWAVERGLVAEPSPKRSRKRLWLGLAVAFVVMFFLVMLLVGGLFATATVSLPPVRSPVRPQTIASVLVPNLVGLKACHARRIARETPGLEVKPFSRSRCKAVVIAQRPAAHTILPRRHRGRTTTVTLRLRG